MPVGLERFQECGDLHYVTFSCYGRFPYLAKAAAREVFECSLERMRQQYRFFVVGYVVMPEHVHLLLSEPVEKNVAVVLQAVKISVARRLPESPFWQRRYYDFNVYSSAKIAEKLGYMHRNPVARGLVDVPGAWPWSSYRYYETGAVGTVQIETFYPSS